MPIYNPLIPTGTVNLDVDYQNLQGNFEQANIVYGTNHYPFDNATPNQGFHNHLTMPVVVNNPPDGLPPTTSLTTTELYAFQQYSALKILQYSRGVDNAVPSPITRLNSPATASSVTQGSPLTILDFTGMTRVFCKLYAMNTAATLAYSETTIVWNGATFTAIDRITGTTGLLIADNLVSVLRLTNNNASLTNAVYWTLEIKRVD